MFEISKSDGFSILQNYTLFVYIKCFIYFMRFGNFSFDFYEVGVVDRGLTNFKTGVFFMRGNPVRKAFKITF